MHFYLDVLSEIVLFVTIISGTALLGTTLSWSILSGTILLGLMYLGLFFRGLFAVLNGTVLSEHAIYHMQIEALLANT